ncbi:MAG: alpha/beta fold hydrolase [Roseobacter sp.]
MTWTTRQRSEGAGALSYYQAGTGPALVLIHGVGLRAEAWGALLPAMSRHFRVICVDMPGHGESALAGAGTLEDFCTRFTQFLAELPIPVFLAGHSMGALLAVELAVQHPRKVAGVAALNAVYKRSDAARDAVQARAASLRVGGTTDPTATLERWFGRAPTAKLTTARDACQNWLVEADVDGYATAYDIFAHHSGLADHTLQALTCPALFMTGDRDLNSTPQMSIAMAGMCMQASAISLPDAAHMMPMTHADLVAKALTETFLKTADRHRARRETD